MKDGGGFWTYYGALAKRMKFCDNLRIHVGRGIDILLIVKMFLTGFDAKMLCVDKNQAFTG